jgi:hypothetical protein
LPKSQKALEEKALMNHQPAPKKKRTIEREEGRGVKYCGARTSA